MLYERKIFPITFPTLNPVANHDSNSVIDKKKKKICNCVNIYLNNIVEAEHPFYIPQGGIHCMYIVHPGYFTSQSKNNLTQESTFWDLKIDPGEKNSAKK